MDNADSCCSFVTLISVQHCRFFERTRSRKCCLCSSSVRPPVSSHGRIIRGTRASATGTTSEAAKASAGHDDSKDTEGVIVVVGKFDAFHRGHRELVQAAAELGAPTLLSFAGMAEALGWRPRASVVAPVERPAIMRTWSSQIGRTVSYRMLPFSEVQSLSPNDFLEMIRSELGAVGLVCGPDWRFGQDASGTVDFVQQYAKKEQDFKLRVVDPVLLDGDQHDVVSSSAVRAAIAAGNVDRASRLMDRLHRLVGYLSVVHSDHVECIDFVNQVPAEGTYQAVVRVLGQWEPVHCFIKVQRRDLSGSPDRPVDFLGMSDAAKVLIYDASAVFCEDCEVYIDFIRKVS